VGQERKVNQGVEASQDPEENQIGKASQERQENQINQAQHSAKRSKTMKKTINTFLTITICAGLLIAGAETENLTTQMLASIGGVMLFAAGCLGICKLNREE
jgi:heme O synthase-like polyprenyltransferase